MGEFADHVSVKDAAAELGVTKARVDQYIRDGRLAVALVYAGVRLLRRKDVEAFRAAPKKKRGPQPKPKKGKK